MGTGMNAIKQKVRYLCSFCGGYDGFYENYGEGKIERISMFHFSHEDLHLDICQPCWPMIMDELVKLSKKKLKLYNLNLKTTCQKPTIRVRKKAKL